MIRLLDQNTIDQIAAGEVVERPASIVKELVENAIDAGATLISCEISEGGISLIRVTDNGCGIPEEDVPRAFLRHATSKIQSASDLSHIVSLGFRGEALSSIASVAEVEMITKSAGSDCGFLYRMEGGREIAARPTGAPDGTTIYVRNLFYNTPARRKFLRTPATEAGHIQDLMTQMALSHPEIGFTFINNSMNRLQTAGTGNLEDVIVSIYGRGVGKQLIPVEYESPSMKISGFAGTPDLARGNRKFEHYFMNGRYFQDAVFAKAIEDAYRPYLMQHKYPFVVLHAQMDTEKIDVNVHPGKLELRFQNRSEVYKNIMDALSEALAHREMIPEVTLAGPDKKTASPLNGPVSSSEIPEQGHVLHETAHAYTAAVPAYKKSDVPAGEEEAKQYFLEQMRKRVEAYHHMKEDTIPELSHISPEKQTLRTEEPVREGPAPEKPAETGEQLSLFNEAARKDYRLIGQLFNTYWIIEYRDRMLLIDQHAAHEKVLYERILKRLHTEGPLSQRIAPPVILPLSLTEKTLLAENMDVFTRVGFEIEHFEGNDYALRAVPSMLEGIADKELFTEMLDDLDADMKSGRYAESLDLKIATMACKAAVKGRQKLSGQEAEALLDELLSLDNPYNCPHGRPTMIVMSQYEIEKKFKRIV